MITPFKKLLRYYYEGYNIGPVKDNIDCSSDACIDYVYRPIHSMRMFVMSRCRTRGDLFQNYLILLFRRYFENNLRSYTQNLKTGVKKE